MTCKMRWLVKSFHELSNDELYDALKLRIDVFVVEQQCFYPDLDNQDRHPQTLHILCYALTAEQSSILAGYLRILPLGQTYDDYVSIGRVATSPLMRGEGIGHQLMAQALSTCQQHFPNQAIKISAQEHLQAFYRHYDFIKVSDTYLEDNIPHVAMLRKTQ